MIIISQVPCYHSQKFVIFCCKHQLNQCFLVPRGPMLRKLQTPGNAQGLGFEYIPKVDHYTSMYM